MCWLVKTRFCLGIWLHDPQNDRSNGLKNATVTFVEEYAEAVNQVRQEAGDRIDMERFRPNRLYQIRDQRIFSVFYNRKKTGFVETEKIEEFMQRNQTSERFFYKKHHVDYNTAIAMVTAYGADTGSNSILLSQVPICGRLYERR